MELYRALRSRDGGQAKTVTEAGILEALATPCTGAELLTRMRIRSLKDVVTVYSICVASPEIQRVFSGQNYLRIRKGNELPVGLCPSMLRSFLNYEVFGRAGDTEFPAAVEALRLQREKISREKKAVAKRYVEGILKDLTDSRGIVCMICGDVVFDMSHWQQREETSTGELVNGSDIDVVFIVDNEAVDRKALDKVMYDLKWKLLRSCREEFDYVIKPFRAIQEYAGAIDEGNAVRVKVIMESAFLAGDRGLYEKVVGTLEQSVWPAFFRARLAYAKTQRDELARRAAELPWEEWDRILCNEFLGEWENYELDLGMCMKCGRRP
jgi:hypothetical protein